MKASSIVTGMIVFAVLAGGGAYWYYVLRPGQEKSANQAAPDKAGGFAIPVETAPVRTGTITRTVEAVGSLRANEAVIVRSELDGRIKEIHFQEGRPVAQGDPLFSLEASIYQAELDQAEARLALSRTNYQRLTSLRGRGLSTGQELDQALAELRANQAAVALAQARLAKTVITAPFDAVMGLRQVSVGDYVQAGQDMVNLLDLDPIKVDFRVPELYLPDVKVGQAIEVRVDAFPGENFSGEVYAIDPQVDVNGRSLVLRARVPNENRRLQAGLFARVDLILERRENALLIPEDALVPQGEQQFVFQVVDGKAARTAVTIGQRQGTQVEITAGLTPDARVVTGGQIKIRDGMPVQALTGERG
ncbi:MAG: efflux RND transporter periplasmic adaptor subunit [Candidatus Competibacterales bacterium]|nr:efflux RND transporter periplasmic adaptor subunit [Candidatus Competibacterales bacterium]